MVMVDLHCHLLPGIDDGSKNMDISRLAREATENGVTHALLTPHHMNGRYVNHKQDVIRRTNEFQEQLKAHNIPLTVFPGQEVRINGQLLDALDKDDILFADTGNRYLILEFPDDDVPHYTNQMIFDLQQREITPVIVHPERNTKIMEQPDLRSISYWRRDVCPRSRPVPMWGLLARRLRISAGSWSRQARVMSLPRMLMTYRGGSMRCDRHLRSLEMSLIKK